MSTTINPELRDLQQKVDEMRISLAKTQGEVEVIRLNSERNDRQTTRQFVLFTITMLIAVVTSLVGTSIFQTDALRREMNARFETVDQRFMNLEQRMDSLEKRMDSIEKRMDSIETRMENLEKSIDELRKEIRSRR